MTPLAPILSVITDEIASSLDEVLEFAEREQLTHLEVRQIDGTNFLLMPPGALRAAARRIADAGLTVTGLTTPLLKWPAPGQPFIMKGDQFGFDPRGKPLAEHYRNACEAAHILGTRYLRIFSYLAHSGFAISELEPELEALLRLAEEHDLILLMENEPVCNINDIAGLLALMEQWRHPRLRCLLDIGNVYGAGGSVSMQDLESVMPYVHYMHIKDYDLSARRHAILGTGSVPFATLLPECQARSPVSPMVLSLEVHVPGGAGPSLRALRILARALVSQEAR